MIEIDDTYNIVGIVNNKIREDIKTVGGQKAPLEFVEI
jgi:hypothetical protein